MTNMIQSVLRWNASNGVLLQSLRCLNRIRNSNSSCVLKNWNSWILYPKSWYRYAFFWSEKQTILEKSSDEDDVRITVSIVGPPNAGKSTLFNRLMCKESNRSYRLSSEKQVRHRISGRLASMTKKKAGGAIVSPIPGTTRDRRECIGRIGGTCFTLFDTAGVDADRLDHLVGRCFVCVAIV